MNIIFLDVDGILNSLAYFEENKEKGHAEISDYHLQMLAKIYHACDCKIVLSSSWRTLDVDDVNVYWMYQYLLDELARYDMEIIDKTPVLDMDDRPLEILTWLEEHGGKDSYNFVSLDDDWSKEHYDKYGIGDHLVKTEFFCDDIADGGLQERHVEQAINILRGNV